MWLFCCLFVIHLPFIYISHWRLRESGKSCLQAGLQSRERASPVSAFSCCRVFAWDSFCLLNQDCIWPQHGQHLTGNWEISNTAKLRNALSRCQSSLLFYSNTGILLGLLQRCCICAVHQKPLKVIRCRWDARSTLCWKPLDQYTQTFQSPPSSSFLTEAFCSCCLLPPAFLLFSLSDVSMYGTTASTFPLNLSLTKGKNANRFRVKLKRNPGFAEAPADQPWSVWIVD